MVSRFFKRGDRKAETLCEQLRALGSDLVDGECDEETLARLEAHLEECVDCDGWMSSFKSTINLIREIPERRPPEELLAHIRQATTRSK